MSTVAASRRRSQTHRTGHHAKAGTRLRTQSRALQTHFRTEMMERLSAAVLSPALLHAVVEVQLPDCDAVMYRIGARHYLWIHIFPAIRAVVGSVQANGCRALVSIARRITVQKSRECTLCESTDDVVAAVLAEVRRLQMLDAL